MKIDKKLSLSYISEVWINIPLFINMYLYCDKIHSINEVSLEYDDKLQSNTFLSIVANDGKFFGITKTQGEKNEMLISDDKETKR